MIRLFARHKGKHVPPRSPCGHRGSSGSLYCTEPADHVGPHIDATEVGTISWPREERLAIEAPERERPSWRERLAGGVSALIDATARGMAWLLEEEARAAGLPVPDRPPEDVPRPESGYRESSNIGPGHPEVVHTMRVGDTHLVVDGIPIDDRCTCIIGSAHGWVSTSVQDCPVHGTLPPEQDEERTEIMGAIRVPAQRKARNIWAPPRPETRWEFLARTGVPESLRYVAEILAAPLPQVRALTAAT